MQHCVVTESLGQILLRASTFTMGDCWESNGSNWAAFDMYVAHKGTSKLLLNSKPQNWDRKRRGQHATRRMKFRVGQDNIQGYEMYCTQYFEHYMYYILITHFYERSLATLVLITDFGLLLHNFCYLYLASSCTFAFNGVAIAKKFLRIEKSKTWKKIVEMLFDSTIDLATEMWSYPSMHCGQIRNV